MQLAGSPTPSDTVSYTRPRIHQKMWVALTDLELNPGLCNIPLTSATTGNLLCLCDLASNSLGAEILEGVSLDGVDA